VISFDILYININIFQFIRYLYINKNNMNDILKVIEERFESKKQQRYFYAKANDKSLSKKERAVWKKRADEFSADTNFKKLPEKVKSEVDEIVDEDGNIISGGQDGDAATKGVTSKSTTDQVMKTAHGQMGAFGTGGATNTSRVLKYWAEADMTKELGFDDTMGQNLSAEEAEEYYVDELELSDEDAKKKMETIGYDEELPGDENRQIVRLVENPNKYIEEYVDNILSKKSRFNDILSDEKIDNPIILKQIDSLKQSIKNNNLSMSDIVKLLATDE
jgi:hypothetical protein